MVSPPALMIERSRRDTQVKGSFSAGTLFGSGVMHKQMYKGGNICVTYYFGILNDHHVYVCDYEKISFAVYILGACTFGINGGCDACWCIS